ncbi:MAG: clan AA aspartic protease [Planctomycetia bacterium]|nr:clan AA aspartic protease [Planctomycetia bacterium]
MIRGTVNTRHEAIVQLHVRGPSGTELDVDAVIDTAFTGFLTLPSATISALNLPFRALAHVQLGDGAIGQFDVYDAEVEWDGAWLAIRVTEIEGDALLGMGLLTGHEVFIEFVTGGVVDITRMP